jgi:hypothetical protein
MFSELPVEEQARMRKQCELMNALAEVLKERIDAFPPVPEGESYESFGGTVQEAMPTDAKPIDDINTLAMLVDHWHGQKFEQGNRLLEIPEGTTIEVEDDKNPGQVIAMDLNGPFHQVFKVGVMTVLHLFKDLPFGASLEDDPSAAVPGTEGAANDAG